MVDRQYSHHGLAESEVGVRCSGVGRFGPIIWGNRHR